MVDDTFVDSHFDVCFGRESTCFDLFEDDFDDSEYGLEPTMQLDDLLGWPPKLLHNIHTHGKRKRKQHTEGIESSIQAEAHRAGAEFEDIKEGRLSCDVTNGARQREEEGRGGLGVDEEGGYEDRYEPIGEPEPMFNNNGVARWFDAVNGLYPARYEHGWDGYQSLGGAFLECPSHE